MVVIIRFCHIKNGDWKERPSNFKRRNYLMTLPYNQRGFKVENNMIAFSHQVNDVNLSFDISNLANCLKIKQVEIVNGDSYKTRGKFSICVAYDADIEDSFLIKESENRSTQSLGNVSRLIQFLTYKARLVGKSVIKINRKHTTKKCCYY